MHKMGLVQSATCNKCNEKDETPLHFLVDCLAVTVKRRDIFGHHTLTANMVYNVKMNDILRFFKEIQRWNFFFNVNLDLYDIFYVIGSKRGPKCGLVAIIICKIFYEAINLTTI